MRVFITGGSGLIGRHLARRLLATGGHQPVILSRHSDAIRRKPEFRDCQVVQGDPSTEGRWQGEVDGCDAVVNLAGPQPLRRALERQRSSGRSGTAGSTAPSTSWRRSRQARNRPQVLVQASAIGYLRPARRRRTRRGKPRRGPISWPSSAASGNRPPSRSPSWAFAGSSSARASCWLRAKGALAVHDSHLQAGPGARPSAAAEARSPRVSSG